MKVNFVSIQGLREHMEDRYFVDSDFAGKGWTYAGIYDGHGGKTAADIAAEKLHTRFFESISSHLPTEAFKLVYESISEEIVRHTEDGTCAVDFLIKDKEIIFANAGDSRLIVIGEKVRQLTIDHRLDNEKEKKRIIEAGGNMRNSYVFTGFRGLMVTRSLGDKHHKVVGVIAMPDVGKYSLLPTDKYIVAGTDGLFDYLSNEKVAEIVMRKSDNLANTLKDAALEAGSRDNITIITVNLP